MLNLLASYHSSFTPNHLSSQGGLLPHTDGYVYGDAFPDFVLLLCEEPVDGRGANGGGNTLLDGRALIAQLAPVASKRGWW